LVAQLVGKKKKDKSETKTGQTKNVRNKNEKTISRQKKRWRALIAPKLVRAANLPISKSPWYLSFHIWHFQSQLIKWFCQTRRDGIFWFFCFVIFYRICHFQSQMNEFARLVAMRVARLPRAFWIVGLIHTHTHTHTCMCVCVCLLYGYVCMYVCICMHACMHVLNSSLVLFAL